MALLFLLQLMVIGFLVNALYRKGKNGICRSKKRLDGKTCLVTGGTSGLGLEVSIDLAMRGARVIVACPFVGEGKNAEKRIIEESGNSNVVFKLLDLASYKSVRKFAADILNTEERLDILMNNAGIGGAFKNTEDGLNTVLQVNYLGHFLLTLLLLSLLKKSGTPSAPSRIVNTTSETTKVAVTDVEKMFSTEGWFMYANSKLCLVLFSRELKKRLNNSNVVINNADPGGVGTTIFVSSGYVRFYIVGLYLYLFGKTPYEGAQTPLHVALDEKAGQTSGLNYEDCIVCESSKLFQDEALANGVWDKSVELVELGDKELNNLLQ